MAFLYAKFALSVYLRQRCAIHDASPALIKLLHGLYLFALDGSRQILEEWRIFLELEGWHCDDRHCLGNGWELFVREALEHVAELKVFIRCLSILVDGSIVVVARDVGGKSWRVGSCPVAEGCSSVSHIQGEGNVFAEHLLES